MRNPARQQFIARRVAAVALFAVALLMLVLNARTFLPAAEQEASSSEGQQYETLHLRGRIVWLAEALERRFGVSTVQEAGERVLALETNDGTLHPIVEDVRGRALRRDERLRKLKDVELMVRRYDGSPFVQIIRLYSHENGKRYELDYWCEICAIAMFELKACDCCQGPIELRRREAPPR